MILARHLNGVPQNEDEGKWKAHRQHTCKEFRGHAPKAEGSPREVLEDLLFQEID